jgi:hypothetical protein
MWSKCLAIGLSLLLVSFLVGFGACVTPTEEERSTPSEGGETPAAEEEEEAPKIVRFKAGSDLAKTVKAIEDLDTSPEGINSVRLTFTSTFTGDKAESGTYDIRCSTEPITQSNCMNTPPLLPPTRLGVRDVWIGTYGGASIMADEDEGEEVIHIIEGLKLDTTYYFVVWIINKPLESYDYYKEDDGDYKFTGVDLTDEDYRESMSNIATYTTPSTETRTAIFTAGACDVLRVGGEACTPRDAVADWIDDNYYGKLPCCKDCGEEQAGRYWAHSFTDLTFDGFEEYLSVIDSATLKIHLRNNDENDHLKIGFINASGDSWEVNQQLTYFDVAVGETKTITVDLNDVAGVSLLEDMMFNNFLDVAVDDDSTVYCLQLILEYTCISIEDWPEATAVNKGGFAVSGRASN